METIILKDVCKTYRRYRQDAGLKNMLRYFLHRPYENVEAVKNISFTIEQGEKVALIGPNGSGKSTTMKLLSGILTPTHGGIQVNRSTPHLREGSFLKSISLIMGQKTQLWWDLPAMDTFLLMKELYEISDSDFSFRLLFLLDALKVQHLAHIQVRKLSLGERMKMEFISGLLHTPQLLLLDEPSIGLDYESQASILGLLEDYNARFNSTILLTSHYLKDVTTLCKRAIVLGKGKIIFDGEIERLKQQYARSLLLSIRSNAQLNWHAIGKVKYLSDNKVVIETSQTKLSETLDHVRALGIEEFFIEEPSIEEALTTLFNEEPGVYKNGAADETISHE